jgi:hypothetical protein
MTRHVARTGKLPVPNLQRFARRGTTSTFGRVTKRPACVRAALPRFGRKATTWDFWRSDYSARLSVSRLAAIWAQNYDPGPLEE